MERIAPAGPVYQAGTLSGNPLAVAAGLATLEQLADDDGASTAELERDLGAARRGHRRGGGARRRALPRAPRRLDARLLPHRRRGAHPRRRRRLRPRRASPGSSTPCSPRGVHLPPSPYEALFVSAAHGEAEIDATLAAFDAAPSPRREPPA